MLHTYRNTDVPCESYFGLLKYFKEKFANLSTANADAMAHAKRNGLFSVPAPLVLARRKLNRERRAERPKKMKVARRGQLMMIDGRLRAVMMTSARRGVATAKARSRRRLACSASPPAVATCGCASAEALACSEVPAEAAALDSGRRSRR